MTKTTGKIGTVANFFNLNKNIYKKPIVFNGEILNAFILKLRTKQDVHSRCCYSS